MNDAELYRLYLEQLAQQEQANRGNTIDNIKGYASKANKVGNNLQAVGDALKNNVNNQVARKIGTSMSNVGGSLSNGATSVQNALNAPKNYFKGWANQKVGSGLTKAGQYLANKTGFAGTVGNGLQNLGSSMTAAGTGTGAGAGTATAGASTGTAATGAGATTAGTTAAGAGTVGATGAGATAGGAAAGGGAAGGSSAGGAAAGGPIGALIALGIMAAAGTNRKRAKKSGQALMQSTNQEVNQGADAALAQTQQAAEQMSAQANQDFQNGLVTGGAAPVNQTQDNKIAEYQDYLRQNGYSDEVVNGVPQGLNGGHQDVADWINQYNNGAGQNTPINIPQTEEEIAAARAGNFNTPQAPQTANATQNVKQGLLDKFISGISDFSKGYDENRNTAFNPQNLQRDNNKGAMNRIGEVAGTIGRMAQKPAVQALVAGGLSTALTGNPLYGLGMANKFAEQRARTNAYQNALQQQGINYDPGMFGTLNGTDFNSLMTPQYKEAENNLALAKLNEQQNYHDLMMKYYNDKLEETKKQNNVKNQQNSQKIAIQAKNANTKAYAAKNKGAGKAQTASKPQQHKDWNGDLAGFTQIITNPKYIDKADEAKARFINKYGVDPMKYIKL